MRILLLIILIVFCISCDTYRAVECTKFNTERSERYFDLSKLKFRISKLNLHKTKPLKLNENERFGNQKREENIQLLDYKYSDNYGGNDNSYILTTVTYKADSNKYYDDEYYPKRTKEQVIELEDSTQIEKKIKTSKTQTSVSVPITVIGVSLGILTGSYMFAIIFTLFSCILCISSIKTFKRYRVKMKDYKKWINLTYICLAANLIIGIIGTIAILALETLKGLGSMHFNFF
jgi:hypothetical protein